MLSDLPESAHSVAAIRILSLKALLTFNVPSLSLPL